MHRGSRLTSTAPARAKPSAVQMPWRMLVEVPSADAEVPRGSPSTGRRSTGPARQRESLGQYRRDAGDAAVPPARAGVLRRCWPRPTLTSGAVGVRRPSMPLSPRATLPAVRESSVCDPDRLGRTDAARPRGSPPCTVPYRRAHRVCRPPARESSVTARRSRPRTSVPPAPAGVLRTSRTRPPSTGSAARPRGSPPPKQYAELKRWWCCPPVRKSDVGALAVPDDQLVLPPVRESTRRAGAGERAPGVQSAIRPCGCPTPGVSTYT
ncbi:hypothetical protein RKD33_000029 [Streptomyces sp. SAI-129]